MSPSLELRRVGPADLDFLATADPWLADTPTHRAHIAALLGAGLSWAAVVDEQAIGLAVVTRHFFGFPFVDLLLVAETARRGGAGAALLARCESDHDADRIFTSTNESNAPMRRLLEKAGWLASGQVDNLDPGDPELVFVKLKGPR